MHRFAANDIRPVYTLTSLFLACIQVTSSPSQPRLYPKHPPAPPPKRKLMWVLVAGKVAVNSNVNPLLSNKCPPHPFKSITINLRPLSFKHPLP